MAVNYDLNNTGQEVQERLDRVMPNKSDIEQEVLDRQSGDNALQEQIDAINTEIGESGQGGETINGRLDELESAVGSGGSVDERIADAKAEVVGGASEDYDTLGKVEGELVDTYRKDETYSKEQLDSLITTPDVEYVTVIAVSTTTDVTTLLPNPGAADTIYRVGNWDGTQYDPTVYSLYAWNGSAYILLAVRTSIGEVYDISVNHPDGQGNPAIYTDIANALGTNGINVPTDIRRGGMSVKFIKVIPAKYSVVVTETTTQPTGTALSSAPSVTSGTYEAAALTDFSTLPSATGSANAVVYYYDNSGAYTVWTITMASAQGSEYKQYRLMATAFSINASDWQGVDAEPTAGSKNLVESGGVEKYLAKDIIKIDNPEYEADTVVRPDGTVETVSGYCLVRPVAVNPGETFFVNQGASVYNGSKQALLYETDSSGNWVKNIIVNNTWSGKTINNAAYTNTGNDIVYVGTCTYTNSRKYSIEKYEPAVGSGQLNEATETLQGDIAAEAERAAAAESMRVAVDSAQSFTSEQKAQGLANLGISGIDSIPVKNSSKLITSGGVDTYSKQRSTLLSLVGAGSTFAYSTISNVFLPGHTYKFTILNDSEWECPTLSDSQEVFTIRAYNNAECVVSSSNNKYSVRVSGTATYKRKTNGWYAKSFVYTLPATVSDYTIDRWYVRVQGRASEGFELLIEAEDITESYNGRDEVALNVNDGNFVTLESDGYEYGLNPNTTTGLLADGGDAMRAYYKQLKQGDVVRVVVTGTPNLVYRTTKIPRLDVGFTDRETISSAQTLQNMEFVMQTDGFLVIRNVDTCKFLVKNKGVAYRVKQLEDAPAVTSDVNEHCALLDKKLLLEQNRGYYFDDTWDSEISSYTDTSYLDRKIDSVPEGKHFIFVTDSHIDYTDQGQAVGVRQDTIPVIKYVRDRMSIKNVVFGGDCIGKQASKYKAAKVLSVYAKGMFEAFGEDFLWVMGNHDLNGVNVADRAVELISDVEAYKRTTKIMEGYGNIVFPTKLIDIIDDSDDLVDYAGNAMTSDEKEEFKAWVKQNYYYDDNKQKIRYIVLETGDAGNTMRDIFGVTADSFDSLQCLAYFIIEAMQSIPSEYDLVVLGHMTYSSGGFWTKVIYKLMAAYKNKQSITINCSATDGHSNVNSVVSKTFDSPSSISSVAADLSLHSGSGRIIFLSGHYHYDRAAIYAYRSDSQSASVSSFALTTSTTPQELTYTNDSILSIRCDRSCAIERGSGGIIGGTNYISGAYSYPDDISHSPSTGFLRYGTIKEVLFDVVTLTPDNRVVLTRFGAEGEDNGLPYVRDYVLPMASE